MSLTKNEVIELFQLNDEAFRLATEVANDSRRRLELAKRGAEIESRYTSLVDRLPRASQDELPFDSQDPILDARFIQADERVVSTRLARVLDRVRSAQRN